MPRALTAIALAIFLAGTAAAFEIDGLRSGMSLDEAKKALEGLSYGQIEVKENTILASDGLKDNRRLISATFCKGKLVQAQKHLKPSFSHFVKLVDEKRKALGKPMAAWTVPPDIESSVECNAVAFLWNEGPTFIKVSYTEFSSNNQLDVLYEIKNSCWQAPW